MRQTFITALQNIKITEDLSAGDKIGDSMLITNNPTPKSKILTPQFKEHVGLLEFSALKNCNAYLYSTIQTDSNINHIDYLTGQMYCAQDFLMASWLEKNNSANFEMCFLVSEDKQQYGVSSNFLSHRYWGIGNAQQETKFTRDELRRVRRIHADRLGIKMEQLPIPDSQFKDDNLRVGRALTWINAARGSHDYSIRVANFCTAFETLFSTTHNEIAHQLSERIAVFLHHNHEDRINAYQSLKRAYELRSRIVHGSTTTQTSTKNPADIASQCESMAREVITKIISNDEIFDVFNKSNDFLGRVMLNMVLAGKFEINNSVSN